MPGQARVCLRVQYNSGSFALFNESSRRPRWSIFSFALASVLALALLTACGSSDDPTPTTAAAANTPAGAATTPATGATPATGTTPGTGAGTIPGATTDDIGAVGLCLSQSTDAQMVEDLRAGNTQTAEDVYRSCLSDVLPPAMVAQLDPVIESTAACGTTAAEGLSDQDIAALESGDQTVAERVSTETLNCLSQELGIPVS
jgi:hypothetical protein